MLSKSKHSHAGIYKFTNQMNGKVYIGQARNIYKRYYCHRELRAKGLFCKALKKYGIDGFNFEILERVDELSTLNQREQYWMDFYKSYEIERGYNICRVAGKPLIQSQMRINKLNRPTDIGDKNGMFGKSHTSETREKIKQKALGRKVSHETKLKMSQAHSGKSHKQEHKFKISKANSKNIAQIDPNTGQIIRIWTNAKEVAQEKGLTISTIRECCMGYYWDSRAKKRRVRLPFLDGFKWQYIQE